jgi:hypothetical protein
MTRRLTAALDGKTGRD